MNLKKIISTPLSFSPPSTIEPVAVIRRRGSGSKPNLVAAVSKLVHVVSLFHDLAGPLGAVLAKSQNKAIHERIGIRHLPKSERSGLLGDIDTCLDEVNVITSGATREISESIKHVQGVTRTLEGVAAALKEESGLEAEVAVIDRLMEQIQNPKSHEVESIFTLEKWINLVAASIPEEREVRVVYILEEPRASISEFMTDMIRLASNIIGNATKYTQRYLDTLKTKDAEAHSKILRDADGKVCVTVSIQSEGNTLRVQVRDLGGGLVQKMEDLAVGSQMSNSDANTGHGFGHGVIAEIAQKCGFLLSNENYSAIEGHVGLCVTLTKPYDRIFRVAAETPTIFGALDIHSPELNGFSFGNVQLIRAAQNRKSEIEMLSVGLVDDEASNRNMLVRFLGKLGISKPNIHVWEACDDETSLSAMKLGQLDVLFIDNTGKGMLGALPVATQVYEAILKAQRDWVGEHTGVKLKVCPLSMPLLIPFSGDTVDGFPLSPQLTKPIAIKAVRDILNQALYKPE